MDPMQALVTHMRTARYDDLSPEVVEAAKITVLDTMGAALAGSAWRTDSGTRRWRGPGASAGPRPTALAAA